MRYNTKPTKTSRSGITCRTEKQTTAQTGQALVPYLRLSSSLFAGVGSPECLGVRRPAPTSAAHKASSARSLPPNMFTTLLTPPPAPLFQLGIKVSSSRAWEERNDVQVSAQWPRRNGRAEGGMGERNLSTSRSC